MCIVYIQYMTLEIGIHQFVIDLWHFHKNAIKIKKRELIRCHRLNRYISFILMYHIAAARDNSNEKNEREKRKEKNQLQPRMPVSQADKRLLYYPIHRWKIHHDPMDSIGMDSMGT